MLSATVKANVPAYLNNQTVDTIGVGDNFVAGFITAILDGLPLEECAKFANATASISVGAIGSMGGVKNKQQVLDKMGT